MANPKRTQAEIKTIHVNAASPGVNGWVVSVRYTDGKAIDFIIDYGKEDEDMLQRLHDCMVEQLKGTHEKP